MKRNQDKPMPEELQELIERWKVKKEEYREEFNHGWPAKLVEISFFYEGEEYSIYPETLGLDEYDNWDHGLMECFQPDVAKELEEMGATKVFCNGFLD